MSEQNQDSAPPLPLSAPHPATWLEEVWRPVMAFIYSLLVLFDYLARPLLNLWYAKRMDVVEVVSAVRDLDPTVAVRIVDAYTRPETIGPVLSEFVHLTFAAVLGIAAFRRVFPDGVRRS